MPGTILFGIDIETASDHAVAFAEHGGTMFKDLGVPTTWFLTGRTLECYPDLFRAIESEGRVDLQAHTYDHILLKTVLMKVPEGQRLHGSTNWHLQPASSLQEIDEDLGRCQQVFQDVLGRRGIGLTTPWAYYRGLGDRLDLLQIVHSHGFRALRSFGRNEWDAQPVPLEWQPFFYKVQAYPDILECFIHDYQDDFYWKAFGQPTEGGTYEEHLRKTVERVANENLVWSMCSHDHGWSTPEGRERKSWIRPTLEYALSLGVRFMTISQYYEEMVEPRPLC